MDSKIRLKQHVAMLKACGDVHDNFHGIEKDYPNVGDIVNPAQFYGYGLQFKVDKVPQPCKLTKDEILSTPWTISGLIYGKYDNTKIFTSVNKINGRKRLIRFKGYYDLKFEVVHISEYAQFIKDYRAGKYTLIELLKIFRERKWHTDISFKHLFYAISGNEYLDAIEEIEKEQEL